MATYLDKNNPQFLFHEWVNQPDTVSDTLAEFETWINDEYQGSCADTSNETREMEEKIILDAIHKFCPKDNKSAIEEYEQELLSRWTKSVNGD